MAKDHCKAVHRPITYGYNGLLPRAITEIRRGDAVLRLRCLGKQILQLPAKYFTATFLFSYGGLLILANACRGLPGEGGRPRTRRAKRDCEVG